MAELIPNAVPVPAPDAPRYYIALVDQACASATISPKDDTPVARLFTDHAPTAPLELFPDQAPGVIWYPVSAEIAEEWTAEGTQELVTVLRSDDYDDDDELYDD